MVARKRCRRRRRKQQQPDHHQACSAQGHCRSDQEHQRLSSSAVRRVAKMITRGQYNETLFAAVNEVEEHLVQSSTSLSLQHALSAAVAALRQRLRGDAALCHVRVLMRNLRRREQELQSFPAFDPDPGTVLACGNSKPLSPPSHERRMPPAPIDEFILLEQQLRRARHAYAALSRRPSAETLAAQLLLCVGKHGAHWRRAHLDALREEDAEAEAVVVAPGLCSAATAWQWAKQVQYDAKVALARGATGRAEACLCASEKAFGWAAARAAAISAAAGAAAAAATATAAATFAQKMPSHALAMEKRIRGGTAARLGKFVARKGGGWDQSGCTSSAVSHTRENHYGCGSANSKGGSCGGFGSKRGCAMSVEELLSSSPLQFIGGLFFGITLRSSHDKMSSTQLHTGAATLQHVVTTAKRETAQACTVLSMRVLSPPRPGAAASVATSAGALQATSSAPSRGAKCARPASAATIMVRKGHSPTAVSTTIAAIERASSHLGSHGFERAATAAATECTSTLRPYHSSPEMHFSPVQSPVHSTTRALVPRLHPGGRRAQAWRLVGAEAAARAAADAAAVALQAAANVAITVEAAMATCPAKLPIPPMATARAAVVKALLDIPPLPVPMCLRTALVTLPGPVPWQCDTTSFDTGHSFYPYGTLSTFRRRLHEVRVSCVCCALACDEEPNGEWAAAVGRMTAWVRSHAVPLDAILLHVGSTGHRGSSSGGDNETDIHRKSMAAANIACACKDKSYVEWDSQGTARSAFMWAVHRIHQRQMQQQMIVAGRPSRTPSFKLLPGRFLSLCEAILQRNSKFDNVCRSVLRRKGALASAIWLLQDIAVVRDPSTARRVLRLIERLVRGHRPSIVSCCRDVSPALLSLNFACIAGRTDLCTVGDAEIQGLLVSTLHLISALAKGGGGCGTRRLVLADSLASKCSTATLAPTLEPCCAPSKVTLMSRSPKNGGCVRAAAAALRRHPSRPAVLSSACEAIAFVAFELFVEARGIDAMTCARGDSAIANETEANMIGGRAGYNCYDYFSASARKYIGSHAVLKAVEAIQDADTAYMHNLCADFGAAVREFVRWDAMGATVSALQCTLAQLSELGADSSTEHDVLWLSVAHACCAAGCQMLFAECCEAADRLGLINTLCVLHAMAEKAAKQTADSIRADASPRPAHSPHRKEVQEVQPKDALCMCESKTENHLRSACISDWLSPAHAAEHAISRTLRLCHGKCIQQEQHDNIGVPLWVNVSCG